MRFEIVEDGWLPFNDAIAWGHPDCILSDVLTQNVILAANVGLHKELKISPDLFADLLLDTSRHRNPPVLQ
jgi:hypothetical protein